MPQFDTITVTPATAVATAGTLVFNYPATRAAASYAQTGEILVASGLQNVLAQAADTFTVAYGASAATITYTDATSLPAGEAVTLQLPLAASANLVDNSGGTASRTIAAVSATYVQAEVRDAVATLAARINAISNTLRANNIT